jgi:hypothetical protein
MNDDEFDMRIRAALEVEAPREQLARLETFWRRESRARTVRRRRFAAAVAACVAAVVGVATWAMRRDAPERTIADRDDPAREMVDQPAMSVDETLPAEGRAPTDYERIMFSVLARRSIDRSANRLATAVDAAIARAAANPKIDAAQVAKEAGLFAADAEPLLLDRLTRTRGREQVAVVRLLGECGTQRSTPALLTLAGRESLRPAILDSIERIVGVDELAGVVRQARLRDVQAALLHRMLTAESDGALRGFLSLVPDPSTRIEALAAAEALESLPIDGWMTLLGDDEKSVRLSAAIVLGHVNGPEITAALIREVTEAPSPPAEAWVALVACRDESAEQFLAGAARQPRWLGQLNNARVTWARMVQ